MKPAHLPSILFTLILLLLVPGPASALLIPEAAEVPYQINNSDRIVIGTVSGIDIHYDYTIFTITVEEWLYNSLPAETIKVRTETGKYVWTEDQAEFTLNEFVLLMLRDEDPDKQLFSVSVGFPGKRPVSDRGAVIEELKVQGKWREENKAEKETNNAGMADEQSADSNPPSDVENAPFTGILWVIVALLGAVCAGKMN
jgi:hypothetical protein